MTALDSESGSRFGYSVSISGNFVIAGAYQAAVLDEDDESGSILGQVGAAYVFDVNAPNTSPQIQQTLSVAKNSFNTSINAYPNPVQDKLSLNFNDYYEFITINITNVLGQQVLNKNYTNIEVVQLNLQEQVKGLYFVEIKTKNKTLSVLKVLKQ